MNDIPSLPIPYHTGQMIVQARGEGLEGMHAKGTGFLEPLLAALCPTLRAPEWHGGGTRKGTSALATKAGTSSICEQICVFKV